MSAPQTKQQIERGLRDAIGDLEDMGTHRHCECDEPPYAPEPGEMGQAECPGCVMRGILNRLHAILKAITHPVDC